MRGSCRTSKSFIVFIMSILVVSFWLKVPAAQAFNGVEDFDNWNNPNVANGWSASEYGFGGGEFNQIIECGQGISCGGDTQSYKSIYQDFPATRGQDYKFYLSAISNCTNIQGIKDDTRVRFWAQFDDEQGNVLATHGTDGSQSYWYYRFGSKIDPGLKEELWRTMGFGPVTAPLSSHHVRVILQVVGGKSGGAVFRNISIQNLTTNSTIFSGMIRNSEWTNNSPIFPGWHPYSYGNVPGDYEKRATGGSAQGISCSGNGTNYKEVYRDYPIKAGLEYDVGGSIVSNAMNISGVKDPSLVSIFVQYIDSAGHVLLTHQRKGSDQAWGNNYANAIDSLSAQHTIFSTIAPPGSIKARIILRVVGGSGGGAIFDAIHFHEPWGRG